MEVRLPKQFEDILDNSESALVFNAIKSFEKILSYNKLFFFPDFTDHGIEHIENVLLAANNLIPEDSIEYLESKDIAVLVISILLHDLGMHILPNGLKKLLNGGNDSHIAEEFDDKTWKEEWNDFFHIAKRFNDKQLINIFGTPDVTLKEPDFDNLDEFDIRLYGEFIRRHHHRLAHEIARNGFPTAEGEENILLETGGPNELLELSGLVARSHGIPVRDTFDFLERRYYAAFKYPYHIKIIYLMVVLRVADYIQIEKERAPKLILKAKRLKSPISDSEWEKHNSVDFVANKNDDPELLYVVSSPKNSFVYLQLRQLFADIQYEFDLSWAILGEAYGRHKEFKYLKLKYRRLQSNLEDKNFPEKVNYIPEKVIFDADPELLKLLIGPLYGENPRYGVRELLQNAVDATKERAHLETGYSEELITITINETYDGSGDYFFEIKDNGIGMSKNTIIDFFFTAGASFRKSLLWKQNFVDRDTTQIQKTGRFGIGVLAAFLLGDSFEFTSRYYNEAHGYTCSASLNTQQIELQKVPCEIGTTIRISIHQKLNDYLNDLSMKINVRDRKLTYEMEPDWFYWYNLDKPKIRYIISDKIAHCFSVNPQRLSSEPKVPSKSWYKFNHPDYKSIHWTMCNPSKPERLVSNLICNGFYVKGGFSFESFPWGSPKVSVFDADAKLPLSLNRDHLLDNNVPFEHELSEAICRLITQSLLNIQFTEVLGYYRPISYPLHFEKGTIDLSNFILIRGDSYCITEPGILNRLGLQRLFRLYAKEFSKLVESNLIDSNQFYQIQLVQDDSFTFYNKEIDPFQGGQYLPAWFALYSASTKQDVIHNTYLPKEKLEELKKGNHIIREQFWSDITVEDCIEEWVKVSISSENFNVPSEQERNLINFFYDWEGSNVIIPDSFRPDLSKTDGFIMVKEILTITDLLQSYEYFMEYWNRHIGENYMIPIDPNSRPKIT